MSKQIFTIPARQNQADKKLKVAAYCRVSTEHEEQRQSLKSQVVYYMQKICDNPDWDFAGIYAEKESGTRVDNRDEIQRLMNAVSYTHLVLCVLVGTGFQVLFHSPPGVLFTFPSQYYTLSVTG